MLKQHTTLNAKQAGVITVLMIIGLYLDAAFPVWGQIAVSVFFWGLFLFIYQKVNKAEQFLLMSCLVLATLGEMFCSLVWGLYDYRFFNIPHYVPPGHVLLFLVGSVLALSLPRWVSYLVPLLVTPYIFAGYWLGFDEFGLVLFLMFAACWLTGEERRLYTTMFLLSLSLEIYGTWLGNWTWRPDVPYWGLSNTNPPLASGAFYCVLDFLVLLLLRAKGYRQHPATAHKETDFTSEALLPEAALTK